MGQDIIDAVIPGRASKKARKANNKALAQQRADTAKAERRQRDADADTLKKKSATQGRQRNIRQKGLGQLLGGAFGGVKSKLGGGSS